MASFPPPIEDYAMIGDCATAALVSRAGGIDWLCLPRFDSGACFAALLGTPEHGRWLIAPQDGSECTSRKYRPGTMILESTFETDQGKVVLIDFMVPDAPHSTLVRLVRGCAGQVEMRLKLTLRFEYGSVIPWVTRLPDRTGVRAIAGPDMAVLRSPVRLRGEDLATVADFTVAEGDSYALVLSHGPSHLPTPPAIDPERALEAATRYWSGWNDQCTYHDVFRGAVCRSLLTLKALTYAPTGGIAAAATTSLPEQLGGPRNWDYRFCWLRDATITLLAMLHAGYREEAFAWREWLHRCVAGSADQIQIMYGLSGERRLSEWEVDSLPGYEGARPVRIGNAAANQLQLDVYGEVLDALYHARKSGIEKSGECWAVERELVEHLEKIWTEPDEGIWEVRGGRRHFTHSKVMCWVALDRAVRSVEEFGLRGPVDRWRDVREQIHDSVCREGYSEQRQSFVQSYGSNTLDASLLMMPLVGFLPADDPRMLGTVAAIERELVEDGFVLRYRTEQGVDGLPPGEGVFLPCSFWLADNWVLQGRYDEANALFERLLSLRNDLGLLTEEYDPRAKRLVGNFPQAFSHVALIGTALNLTQYGPAHQRSECPARDDSS
ncbi:MAG: glycoside hydrolase family 15 protein [Acetobacteraceae bacterium]|nr:glycoside hydrolase family 15 protein [Acetobacteraceae bacterium]